VPDDENCFYVIGLLLGKAVFEGILVESRFAQFFLRKLLGHANLVDDLHSLDREVANSLAQIKRAARGFLDEAEKRRRERAGGMAVAGHKRGMAGPETGTGPAEGVIDDPVEDMCLTFTAPIEAMDAVLRQEPLMPGGNDTDVTSANASRYVALRAHHMLNRQIARQTKAFLLGFRQVVPLRYLRMFTPTEL